MNTENLGEKRKAKDSTSVIERGRGGMGKQRTNIVNNCTIGQLAAWADMQRTDGQNDSCDKRK